MDSAQRHQKVPPRRHCTRTNSAAPSQNCCTLTALNPHTAAQQLLKLQERNRVHASTRLGLKGATLNPAEHMHARTPSVSQHAACVLHRVHMRCPTCNTRSVMCPALSHCTAPWWHRSSSYDSAVTPVARLCRTARRAGQYSAQGRAAQGSTVRRAVQHRAVQYAGPCSTGQYMARPYSAGQGRRAGASEQQPRCTKRCLETGGTQAGHCQQGHKGVQRARLRVCLAHHNYSTAWLGTAHSRVAHQAVCDGAAVLYDLFDGRPAACVDECCRGCDVGREVVLGGPILVDDLWWWW